MSEKILRGARRPPSGTDARQVDRATSTAVTTTFGEPPVARASRFSPVARTSRFSPVSSKGERTYDSRIVLEVDVDCVVTVLNEAGLGKIIHFTQSGDTRGARTRDPRVRSKKARG